MRLKLLNSTLIWFFLISFSSLAQAQNTSSLGAIANSLTDLIGSLGYFFMIIFFMVSLGFFSGFLIKYKIHRDNPAQVTLIVPITLLLLSIAFLLLALIIYYTPDAVLGDPDLTGQLTGTTNL